MNHHVFSTLSESCQENQTTPTNHHVKNNNTEPVKHKKEHESVVFVTGSVCPRNVLSNEPSCVLHTFRVLSTEPDNTNEPSGEKQQHATCETSEQT